MPPITGCEYIVHLWKEAGTVEGTAGGPTYLSWKEIDGWLSVRDKKGDPKLSAWEIEIVRRLSEEYASEYNQGSEKNRKPPYVYIDFSAEQRKIASTRIKSVFDNWKSKDNGKYETEE